MFGNDDVLNMYLGIASLLDAQKLKILTTYHESRNTRKKYGITTFNKKNNWTSLWASHLFYFVRFSIFLAWLNGTITNFFLPIFTTLSSCRWIKTIEIWWNHLTNCFITDFSILSLHHLADLEWWKDNIIKIVTKKVYCFPMNFINKVFYTMPQPYLCLKNISCPLLC